MKRLVIISAIAAANFLAAEASAQTIGKICSENGRVMMSAKTNMTRCFLASDGAQGDVTGAGFGSAWDTGHS